MSQEELSCKIRECPGMVSVLFDSELVALLPFAESGGGLAPWLIGEAMTRLWLYDGQDLPELSRFLLGRCLPKFIRAFENFQRTKRMPGGPQINWPETTPKPPTGNSVEQRAWEWMVERIQAFRAAHGVIAVVQAGPRKSQEAIAIPFRIAPAESRPGEVRDQNGRTVGHWISELNRIQHVFPDGVPMVTLSCDCGSRANLLEGGSLALAILVACWRQYGDLCDYDGLELICTGSADVAEKLTEVDGIEAKRDLARRLGARMFVCPGGISSPGSLAIPIGTLISGCSGIIWRGLENAGIGKLDVPQAHTLIGQLTKEVHDGLVPLSRASTRLERYESVFSANPDSTIAKEGTIFAQLLHGSIANHSAKPQEGRHWMEKAAKFAHKVGQHELYAHAVASSVVSLTDLGLLDQAEMAGRKLVKWIENKMVGPAPSLIMAEMEAKGALGGQPLLQKALIDPSLKAESLKLMKDALSKAEEVRSPTEIARDAVQIALWHALLEPVNAGPEIAKAQTQLDRLGKQGKVSELFLRQYRFLAVYRIMLRGAAASDGFNDWPLPDGGVFGGWVRAVALKYRGALLAAAGKKSAAEKDFCESLEVLDVAEAPLFRFIGATVALQAAASLRTGPKSVWRTYAKKAKVEFSVLKDHLFGPHCDSGWSKRAEGLLAGIDVRALPNPQLIYRY